MSLYSIKPGFVRSLRSFEDACVSRKVSADALTLAAVSVSVGAGALIAAGGIWHVPLLWLAVPPLVLARLALNALDGSVARRTGTDRPIGAALNEIGDRLADAATIGATAFVVEPALAAGATAAAFLASSTGVISFALTGRRDCGGPMGKADRGAVLALGCVIAGLTRSARPLTFAVAVVGVGSLVTVAARLRRLNGELEAREQLTRGRQIRAELRDVG